MCHLYIYPPHYCMFIALVFLAHIYVDLIVSATNVLVVFLSTINKHFLLLLLLSVGAYVYIYFTYLLLASQFGVFLGVISVP